MDYSLLDAFKSLSEIDDSVIDKKIIRESLETTTTATEYENEALIEVAPIENTFTASNLYEGLDEIDEVEEIKELSEAELQEAEYRIDLKKYGFVRAPEEDFSDDGTRFICYYYDPEKTGDKRFELSKAISGGEAYISVHYTAPESGRSKYFDKLNGVSISTAANGIEDLVKEIEEFKTGIDEFSKVTRLTDEQVKELAEEVKFLMDRAGLDKYAAVKRAYSNKGIEYDTVPYEEKRKLDNFLRNAAPYDKAKLEAEVKNLIKGVIHDMSDHSGIGYDRKWYSNPAKSLDDAIKARKYTLSSYPDAVQEKVFKYIKDKIEDLFNFKDESLTEEKINGVDVDKIAHEIIIKLEDEGLVEKLTEAIVNLNDEKEVEEEQEKLEKEKDETPIEQVVDASATITDELKGSYIGNAILQCTTCKTLTYKKPEELEKQEDAEGEEAIYNVEEECPHCGAKDGYELIGQVAKLDTKEQQAEEAEEKEEVEIKETPSESEVEVEEEEKVEEALLTDIDEASFDSHVTKYLKEIYDNVDSYKSTEGSIRDKEIIIEGIIKFISGKEKPTSFKFSLEENNLTGLNESLGNEEKAYSIKGKIENKCFITEEINYKYHVGEELVEGCTKLEEEFYKDEDEQACQQIVCDLYSKFSKTTHRSKIYDLVANIKSDYGFDWDKDFDEIKEKANYALVTGSYDDYLDTGSMRYLDDAEKKYKEESEKEAQEIANKIKAKEDLEENKINEAEIISQTMKVKFFNKKEPSNYIEVEYDDKGDWKITDTNVGEIIDEHSTKVKDTYYSVVFPEPDFDHLEVYSKNEDGSINSGFPFIFEKLEEKHVCEKCGKEICECDKHLEEELKVITPGTEVTVHEDGSVEVETEEGAVATDGSSIKLANADGSIEVAKEGEQVTVGAVEAHPEVGADPETVKVETTSIESSPVETSEETTEIIEESISDHSFEVLWYEGDNEEEAKKLDPVTKEFKTKKDALEWYEFIKEDAGKFDFWVTERDKDGEVVETIIG